MSYITSKLISVNYVRTVFRLRKSDQFTFNHRYSQLEIITAGYPRLSVSQKLPFDFEPPELMVSSTLRI